MPSIFFTRFAAEIEVAGNREVVAETDRLLDRLDPLVDRELRMELGDLLAIEIDLATRRGMDAAEDADQRGLAGAIVSNQADELAGIEVDRDILQGVEGAEVEIQVLHLDERMLRSSPWAFPRQTVWPAQRASFWLKMTATIRTTPMKVMYQDDGAPRAISS